MKKKKNKRTTVILVVLLLAGLSLLLYPTVSDYWNSFHQTRAIASYAETVAELDNTQYDALWEAARHYNEALARWNSAFILSEAQKKEYESLLDAAGPAGYNKLAGPVTIVIGENGVVNGTTEAPQGVDEVKVLNQSGAELPSTGGIGTTIFYVLGGVLVVGAAVLLVTKKRMER